MTEMVRPAGKARRRSCNGWRRAACCCLAAVVGPLALGGCALPTASPGPTARAGVELPTPNPDSVVWAVESAPTTLDPARMGADPAATQIAAQIYDRLVRFRPGTTELAPGIATNWVADPEGRTFTFTLRDGLRFHDGSPLDAVAVAWNFQRWMNPDHPYHQGQFWPWRDYFGGFVGEKDQQGRAVNLVASVEALDPLTVRITLNAPFAPLLHHLAMVPFGFASPAAVQAQGQDYGRDGDHLPVGSGPFRVVAWQDDIIVLAPFADYWSGPPASSGLRFVTIAEPAARAAAVAEGTVHGAELPATMPLTGTLKAEGLRVVARPPRCSAWLMLNHSRPPLGDERVRRAISLAIDRQALAREHFGPRALPGVQLLPPGFLGYEESLEAPEPDLAAARKLLADAGMGDGFKLNIWVANTPRPYLPDPVGTAEAIAGMLQQIGIDAAVRSESLRRFLMDRDRGRFTAWLIGWEAQSADPDNFWFWHFGAGRVASEGQYERPELASVLLDAQHSMNTAQREEAYRQAARMVDADQARIFLAYVRPLVALSTRLQGYRPGPMGFDDFRDVTLAPLPAGSPLPVTSTSSPSPAATSITPAASATAAPVQSSLPAPSAEASPTEEDG